MEMLSVGLIGVGSMGKFVARQILSGQVPGMRLAAVADKAPPAPALKAELDQNGVFLVKTGRKLVEHGIRLVVECANQAAVQENAAFIMSRGIDFLAMSVGAFVDTELLSEVSRQAKENGCRIYLPSGAVGAIDALNAAKIEGLTEVVITTRKPPRSLAGVEGINLAGITGQTVVFEGCATEAVKKFPKNVNVAAVISLAGLGPEKTQVRVVADPSLDRNVHEIHASGAFGSFDIRLANNPSPENPRTSQLACLSVVSMLRKIVSPVQIGS